MDKVLAFSILSASPADVAAGVGSGWTKLSWRRSADAAEPAKASKGEQQQGSSRSSHQGGGRGRQESNHAPRFAPEFDGIDCFETIVAH